MMFNSQEGVQRGITGEWVFATFWENISLIMPKSVVAP